MQGGSGEARPAHRTMGSRPRTCGIDLLAPFIPGVKGPSGPQEQPLASRAVLEQAGAGVRGDFEGYHSSHQGCRFAAVASTPCGVTAAICPSVPDSCQVRHGRPQGLP